MNGNIEGKNIAKSYALSLFEVSVKKHKSETINKDIYDLLKSLKTDSILSKFFYSKGVRSDSQVSVINKSLKRSGMDVITANFLKVLAKNSRLDLIELIGEEFSFLYDQYKLGKEIIVEVPHKLNKNQNDEIKNLIEKIFNEQKTNVQFEIKEDLIAGFRILFGSKVYDFSTANKLQNIKKHLISNL